MLKINKTLKIPLFITFMIIGGTFLYQYLTFTPEHSYAKTISSEPETRTLDDITYMQEMTPDICTSSSYLQSKQLKDARDGKTYWVTKLADENCWMTQNLDLDLTTAGLTSELSDVTGTWDQNSTNAIKPTDTISTAPDSDWNNTTITDWNKTTYNVVQSYDPGVYVFENGNTIPTSADTSGLDKDTSGKKEAHYLVGNYYSFNAATAGTGSNITNDDIDGVNPAPSSICPRGWKLPVSGTNNALSNDSISQSFGRMLSNQDITADKLGAANILGDPLYFVLGSRLNANGTLLNVSARGYYWSSISYSATNAYYLYFTTSSVYPTTYGNYRRCGFPIRCVAAMEETEEEPPVNNPNINIIVDKTITLSIDNPNINIDAPSSTAVITKEFVATVSSNADYTISLNATSSTSLLSNNGREIPTITNKDGEQLEPKTSKWGIRICSSDSTACTNNYLGLPTKNTANTFVTGNQGLNQQTLFQIGIGIGPELPSGTYATKFTVTASQN